MKSLVERLEENAVRFMAVYREHEGRISDIKEEMSDIFGNDNLGNFRRVARAFATGHIEGSLQNALLPEVQKLNKEIAVLDNICHRYEKEKKQLRQMNQMLLFNIPAQIEQTDAAERLLDQERSAHNMTKASFEDICGSLSEELAEAKTARLKSDRSEVQPRVQPEQVPDVQPRVQPRVQPEQVPDVQLRVQPEQVVPRRYKGWGVSFRSNSKYYLVRKKNGKTRAVYLGKKFCPETAGTKLREKLTLHPEWGISL